MCGIVAAVAKTNVVPALIEGLEALEYRGYDSAGLALLTATGLQRQRAKGKVRELAARNAAEPISGTCGIAHTRWATHGAPSERNAHPVVSRERLAVVHNGIIENHAELRSELIACGYEFATDTDTEVIAHLIDHARAGGKDFAGAVRHALTRLEGAYAIAALSAADPQRIVGARLGSPLVVGLADDAVYLASDVQALIRRTRRFIALEDGDVVEIDGATVRVSDRDGAPVERPIHTSQLRADAVERGEYRHYMLKEIHEQPVAISDTLEGRIASGRVLSGIFGVDGPALLARTRGVHIVACGSSWHAGLVARHWIEQFARLPVNVEIASEFRYRDPVVPPDTLLVNISQSGETADTLAAARLARGLGYSARLAICNVPESSLVREADLVMMTRAGPEIGVASTKAFVTQLTALALLALELGRAHGAAPEVLADAVQQLESLPALVAQVLALDAQLEQLAAHFADKQHALFLGRGAQFPIALEGALKLKEISYIHAEAYPAGELKHGPLALIDAAMPVIAVAPNDRLLEKLRSNLEEVRARGGQMIVFADAEVCERVARPDDRVIALPAVGQMVAPILYTVPLQLLAYHVAVLKGTDVDQPRNLAKSVTVE